MKKLATLLLAIVLVVTAICLVGCGEKPAETDKKTLKVGMECAYAPFNWTQVDDADGAVKIANAEGYANGYDVQIAKQIADGLGYALEIYAYEWDALVPAVQSGNLDCIIAGMSPTAERWEVIDFSSNYYVSNLVIILNKDSQYATATKLADFDGARINAQDGTFHSQAVEQIPNVVAGVMADFPTMYNAVAAKTIDGYIAEEPTAFAICAANSDLTFAPLINNDTGFTCDEGDTAIAVGLKKNSDIREAVSAVIDGISVEARSELMQKMVALAPAEE